eukprot:TRINITY_DN16939_c0_g1_i1.p1 TRINITY_DN16939_c0_g1~~TRINITY_DN16939_c0_g1_i1.p1  ORF type:complete len:644 (+),score=282.38 TRINITY_DN16939_c0_g1_i1:43-1932(+)
MAEVPTAFSSDSDTWRHIKWNGWGNKHVGMRNCEDDSTSVLHPSGKRVPGLIPFIQQELHGASENQKPLPATPGISLEEAQRRLPAPILNRPFLQQTGLAPNQIVFEGEARLNHATGKNYRDLWRMRNGMLQRPPDAILLPQCHDDVVKIVESANAHNVCIVPYGGGTNVVGAVEPDPQETTRMVVSLDMRRMNKLLWIEQDTQMACFEVGVLGPDLEEQLSRYGFVLGHDPDSHIHSTLGGWIATRSSGSQSNRYGEMEEMVVSLTIVTPKGVVTTQTAPRATGVSLNEVFIGSEGAFGVITQAVIKIQKRPAVKCYEGWLISSFEDGYEAFRTATLADINPTVMRLYDDDETRLSFAMKYKSNFFEQMLSKGIKAYAERWKGMKLDKICLAIIGFEGTAEDVAHERRKLHKHLKQYKAICIGQGAGRNWQEKKYDLPYIRDWALENGMWADVLETSTDYARAMPLWRDVKAAVHEEWQKIGKRGWIGCHIAHQYKTGLCLYFTFAAEQIDEKDIQDRFLPLKEAATEAILKNKGALTHHHGVGFEHVPWMKKAHGRVGLYVMQSVKKSLDPHNICNPGKLLPPMDDEKLTDAENEAAARASMMFYKMGVLKHLHHTGESDRKQKAKL